MADLLIVLWRHPLAVPVAGAVLAVFLIALLWKIVRSQEGFLFGYGNWVVGKWQNAGGGAARAAAQPSAAVAQAAAVPDPTPKRDVSSLKRALQLTGNVMTLSRLLDGDLAYMMMHDAGEWQTKLHKALQTLVSGVTRVVHPAGRCRCGFFILDDDEQYLALAVGEGYNFTKRPKLALEHSCAGRAFLSGEPYYCRDTATDPVYFHSERGSREQFHSIACVPVRAGQAVFGVICLDAEQANAFTTEDFAHLEVFAAKLAVFCAFHALQVGVCDVQA